MRLSRIWLFGLTLGFGLLLLALLLSPGQVRRSLQGSARSRVELAQQSATLLLANSARLWIDTAAQLASDAALQASLEEQARGQAEPELLHRTVQQQIKKAAEALKLSFVMVTDASGRVVARAGQGEAAWRDSVDGYPVVADAVRGYRTDDLWLEGGVLYRVAAAPIIASARDRYVGAVVLGQAVGDELAGQLRAAVGLDVVFLGAGQVLASSRPKDKVPQALLEAAASQQAALQGGGHSAPLDVGDELAMIVGLPGEAAERGAAIGLLSAGAAGASLRSVLGSYAAAAAEGDLPLWQLPAAAGAVLVAFLIGLLLLRREGEVPIERLLGDVRRAAEEGGAPDESAYRGPLRELAAAIGAALAQRPAAGPAAPAPLLAPDRELGRDLIDYLGNGHAAAPAVAPATPSIPPSAAFAPTLPGPPGPLATPAPRAGSGAPAALGTPASLDAQRPQRPSAPLGAASAAAEPQKPQRPSAPQGAPLSGAPFTPAPAPLTGLVGDSSDTIPQRSPTPAPLRTPSSISPIRGAGIPVPTARTAGLIGGEPLRAGRGLGELEGEGPSSRTLLDPVLEAELEASQLSMPQELPTVQDIPPSVVQAAIEQALGAPAAPFAGMPRNPGAGPYGRPGAQAPSRPQSAVGTPAGELRLGASRPAPDITEEITAVNRTPPVTEEDELEASFRRTYQEFIVTKQRCHEPVEGLTYDKFVVKLKQSRDQIMRQHNCKAVRFHVYVKEGKAALKATPVTR